MLARMYARRLKGYNLMGYTIWDASNETSFFRLVENRSPKDQRAFDERRSMTKRNSRPAVLHRRKLKGQSGTNLASLSKARLKELIEEAIMDAYGEEEQAGGFFAMIEEHLALPFGVKVLGVDADVEKVDMTPDGRIVAICRRGKTRQKIPILDLSLPTPAPPGAEWIVAYRHWSRGTW
jgi:hypothetical protein